MGAKVIKKLEYSSALFLYFCPLKNYKDVTNTNYTRKSSIHY